MREDILAIHQPNLFPNIKVLNKIAISNHLNILDDVQFVRNDVQNRVKIRHLTNPHQVYWLTASIKNTRKIQNINELQFSDYQTFISKLKGSLTYLYSESDYYDELLKFINILISKKEYSNISDFSVASTLELFKYLGINIDISYSSDLGIKEKSTLRLINICKKLGYKNYLSGLGGKNYMDIGEFANNEVTLYWHPWTCPNCAEDLDWNKISYIDFIARFGFESLKKYLQTSVINTNV
ncbi:WbqC family protein [Culicoidibacter larvae]|uniref:WbqC family protein n=1 Tax=Culicoidibacter larvae TaxID=2579976 RepID=A0A5R8QAL8_9FIRM|nr:WbqC family protein [Culicoidibacter larvae]TLG72699.1 WbqC family protein [Culicoidibacter larvae]